MATPDDVVNSVGSESKVARDLTLKLHRIFSQSRRSSGCVEEFFQVWCSLYVAAANVNGEARVVIRRTARDRAAHYGPLGPHALAF